MKGTSPWTPPGSVDAVLLFPGADRDREHPVLMAIEDALAPLVVRRGPLPHRPAAVGREAISLIGDFGTAGTERLVIGGRSMGGRMCSMAVAKGLAVAGLVLLNYPLHPPGRPEQLRTGHFGEIGVPALFVSGTRDPFATPEELEAATALISGPVTHVWVEGGGHSLKAQAADVADAVRSWAAGLRD